MKKFILISFILSLFCACAGTVHRTQSNYYFKISSTPSGGYVYLDGSYQGVTPITIRDLNKKIYQIKIQNDGYNDLIRHEIPSSGEGTTLSYSLIPGVNKQDHKPFPQKKVYSLRISSSPSKAEIYIDGSYKGLTPLTIRKLQTANNKVEIKKEGYETLSTVALSDQEHESRHYDLKKAELKPYPSKDPKETKKKLSEVTSGISTQINKQQEAKKQSSQPSLASEVIPTWIKQRGKIYAVIVGIGEYQNTRLNLRYAVNDAQSLYDVLTDPNYGGIPQDNIKLLLNRDATDRKIKGAIGKWLGNQAKLEDTVIIYYAGHGAPEGDNTYWVTHNADINDLYTTALNNNEIAGMLARVRAKRTITFLDSCYSAATVLRDDKSRAVIKTIPWNKYSGEGRVTISASDGKQDSLELEEYQHGVFTYFLLKGLKGGADANHDGIVDVDEIWDYVKYQVSEAARKAGNPQTPVFMGTIKAGIPLTFNLPVLREKQQSQLKKQHQNQLLKLYQKGLLKTEHFECGSKMILSDSSDRLLQDLLSGKLSPETFGRFFKCNIR